MKIWTWDQLEKEFKRYPDQLKAFQELGSDYPSFEHWLELDMKKSDIVTAVIGCQCSEDFKRQQKEAMEYRQSICDSPKDWFKRFSIESSLGDAIDRISKRFRRQKRCHRNYRGKKAGVRCYCDQHNH